MTVSSSAKTGLPEQDVPETASPLRILILGGTTEARRIADRLGARRDVDVTVSLAGRTRNPLPHAAPTRSGGFGGAGGLRAHIEAEGIDAVIDATHPFAALISRNAAEAARAAGIPLLAVLRAPWEPEAGDIWRHAASVPDAVALLGHTTRRVLVALGRNEVRALEDAPQHAYLIRSIDPIEPPLKLPEARYIEARGPFPEADERVLLEQNRIDAVIAKNSGGSASYGKIAAARTLGIEVILVTRPARPDVATVGSVDEAVAWVENLRS